MLTTFPRFGYVTTCLSEKLSTTVLLCSYTFFYLGLSGMWEGVLVEFYLVSVFTCFVLIFCGFSIVSSFGSTRTVPLPKNLGRGFGTRYFLY